MRAFAIVSAIALSACATDTAELALDGQSATPPEPYEFSVSEVFSFADIQASVAGVPLGSRVVFLGSPNGLGFGPCPPQLGGGCVDLAPPVITIGSTITTETFQGVNPGGSYGAITFPVPASLGFGDTVAFQAVVRDAPGVWTATEAIEVNYGPTPCSFLFAPVCGVDGSEWSNECIADANGIVVESEGFCPVP